MMKALLAGALILCMGLRAGAADDGPDSTAAFKDAAEMAVRDVCKFNDDVIDCSSVENYDKLCVARIGFYQCTERNVLGSWSLVTRSEGVVSLIRDMTREKCISVAQHIVAMHIAVSGCFL